VEGPFTASPPTKAWSLSLHEGKEGKSTFRPREVEYEDGVPYKNKTNEDLLGWYKTTLCSRRKKQKKTRMISSLLDICAAKALHY